MSVVKGCIVAAVALVVGSWAERARADEAYICDAGRVVYVKPGELEAKKQSDPCIARYFDVQPVAPSKRPAAQAAAPATAQVGAVPNSSGSSSSGMNAAPGDHRNVRIINAQPGSDGWFRLSR